VKKWGGGPKCDFKAKAGWLVKLGYQKESRGLADDGSGGRRPLARRLCQAAIISAMALTAAREDGISPVRGAEEVIKFWQASQAPGPCRSSIRGAPAARRQPETARVHNIAGPGQQGDKNLEDLDKSDAGEKCRRRAPHAKIRYIITTAPVAQGIEQRTSNPSVAGSNPARRASNYKEIREVTSNINYF
jgi:hypothetical protein